MAIQWSSAFGSGNSYGKLGLNITKTNTQTETIVKVEIYYRSKYSVMDSANTFYYGWSKSAETKIGAKKINHTSDDAWSSDNITKIKTYTKSYSRTTKQKSINFTVKCKNIEYGGKDGSYTVSITVPVRRQYKIIYNANGGTNPPKEQLYYYGETQNITENIPKKEGAEFLGWSDSKNASRVVYKKGQKWNSEVGKDVILYAVWISIYDIVFDANGGMVNGQITYCVKVKSGVTLLDMPLADKAGSLFVGWNSKADGSGVMYTAVKGSRTMTLYAVYDEKKEESESNVYVMKNGIFMKGQLFIKGENGYREGRCIVKYNAKWR